MQAARRRTDDPGEGKERSRPAGWRGARRLPGRRLRGARGGRAHARLGGPHLHRCPQWSNHRRQPARAARSAPARVLGARLKPSHRCAFLQRRYFAQAVRRGQRGVRRRHRSAGLFRATHSAGRVHAAWLDRGDEPLRYDAAVGIAARSHRFRPSEFRSRALEHRRGAGAHGQHEVFRIQSSRRSVQSTSWRAALCPRASHRS